MSLASNAGGDGICSLMYYLIILKIHGLKDASKTFGDQVSTADGEYPNVTDITALLLSPPPLMVEGTV